MILSGPADAMLTSILSFSSNVAAPILSLDLMDSAQNILQELRREIKSNNQLAKEIVDEIKSISEKLKMPCDLARLQRDFYSSKVIAEVKIRQ